MRASQLAKCVFSWRLFLFFSCLLGILPFFHSRSGGGLFWAPFSPNSFALHLYTYSVESRRIGREFVTREIFSSCYGSLFAAALLDGSSSLSRSRLA